MLEYSSTIERLVHCTVVQRFGTVYIDTESEGPNDRPASLTKPSPTENPIFT